MSRTPGGLFPFHPPFTLCLRRGGGGILTFFSDNPAIISLARDRKFCSYFKKYELVSLTNFGTSFGMGMVVVVFMASQGYGSGAAIGLLGAVVGSIVSTRLMQRSTLRRYPKMNSPVNVENMHDEEPKEVKESFLLRLLNAVLDGGKTGVDLGMAIIPGVLIISTAVMVLTNGPGGADGSFTGQAYEGIGLLPALADKVDFLFRWLFGFTDSRLIAFPITALGAVGAALGLVPNFAAQGILDGNAVSRLHRHGDVLERFPKHPYGHARQPEVSSPHHAGHRGAHHRWTCRWRVRSLVLRAFFSCIIM